MAKLVETKPSKPNPSVSLSEDELEAIKNWKVGQKYTITMNVELTRLSRGDIFMDEKDRTWDASFKILDVSEGGEVEEKEEKKPGVNKDKIAVMKKKMKEYD